MCDDQGLTPVDERFLRGEEIDDVSAFLVGHGVSLGGRSRSGARVDYIAQAKGPGLQEDSEHCMLRFPRFLDGRNEVGVSGEIHVASVHQDDRPCQLSWGEVTASTKSTLGASLARTALPD